MTSVFTLRDLPMPPYPYSPEVEEAVCEEDRQWFEQNPGATERVRAYVPAEAPTGPPPSGHYWSATIVTQLQPGARTRRFVATPKEPRR